MPSFLEEARLRDYLLEEAEFLSELTEIVVEVFTAWGGRRVIPTTFVPPEELLDPATAYTVYNAQGGRPLALRQDLTEQILRILKKLDHLLPPLRLYYLEEVFRSDPVHRERPGERLVAGVEWIGASGEEAEEELLLLCQRILAPVFRGSGLIPVTLVLGSVELYKSCFSSFRFQDPPRAFMAMQRKDLSLWLRTGDPDFPLFPWTLFRPGDPVPEEFPPSVKEELGRMQSFARRLPEFFRVVIDPALPPFSHYYTGRFFALSAGLPYEPWLRGGSYRVDFRGKQPALGFTLDLDPFIEGFRQGLIRPLRSRYYLWMEERYPPPSLPGVRWFPRDPFIPDPWEWGKSQGLDGLVFVEEGRMRVYDPETRKSKEDLGPCPM